MNITKIVIFGVHCCHTYHVVNFWKYTVLPKDNVTMIIISSWLRIWVSESSNLVKNPQLQKYLVFWSTRRISNKYATELWRIWSFEAWIDNMLMSTLSTPLIFIKNFHNKTFWQPKLSMKVKIYAIILQHLNTIN